MFSVAFFLFSFHCVSKFVVLQRALFWRIFITSERVQRAERVLSHLREKSEYSRPDPTRPDPITLFKVLYLRNRMADRQAVFFDEYHLDVKVVWHGYRIASVPVMARGACQTWGTLDDPQNILPQ